MRQFLKKHKFILLCAALFMIVSIFSISFMIVRNNDETIDYVTFSKPIQKELLVATPYFDIELSFERPEDISYEFNATSKFLTFYGEINGHGFLKLYTISIDNNNGDYYGNFLGKDGNVHRVYVLLNGIDVSGWSDQDLNTFYELQESVNLLIGKLPLLQNENDSVGEYTGEDFSFETPYGELVFPARWSEVVQVRTSQGDPYKVSYYTMISGKTVSLFDLSFSFEKFDGWGFIFPYENKDVYMNLCIIELDERIGLTDSEKDIIFAMQEDSNYILDNLSAAPGDSEFIDGAQNGSDDYFEIATLYGNLYFRNDLSQYLRVSTYDSSEYVVAFYASVHEQENVHLFDVVIGNNISDPLGYYYTDTGEEVSIRVDYFEIPNQEVMPEDDLNILYLMQEEAGELMLRLGVSYK